jgi:CheY-like chemotaxis protein
VISDLGLPDGTGFDLIREIHREHAWPAIALSGYGMDEDVRRSHEAGFRVTWVKPIDFKQLERALEDLVTNVG